LLAHDNYSVIKASDEVHINERGKKSSTLLYLSGTRRELVAIRHLPNLPVSRSRGAYEWPRDRIYDYIQSKMIESSFTECGMAIINRSHIHPTRSVSDSTFISLYGASPTVCNLLWNLLTTIRPESARKIHLLYALLLLRNYNNEEMNASLCDCDRKTFRYWSMLFV